MARIALSVIAMVLLTGRMLVAADATVPRSASDSSSQIRAVLFAPSHPTFLKLDLKIDGENPNRFRERFCRQLFGRLDRNKDRHLNKEEVTKLLSQLAEQGESANQPTWEQLDAQPADGKVTIEEFRAFDKMMSGEARFRMVLTMA